MKNKIGCYVLLAVGLSPTQLAWGQEACRFQFKPASFKLTWTGFKFSEKTPVTGEFNRLAVSALPDTARMADLIASAMVAFDATHFDAGHPLRNQNLTEHFFRLVPDTTIWKAYVDHYDPIHRKLKTKLIVGRQIHSVPMKVTIKKTEPHNSQITGHATIDVLKLGWTAAYKKIAAVCQTLHTGADGIAKTWTQVELKVQADIQEVCP